MAMYLHILSAVVLSLSVVKARIVNGSSNGNDEMTVKDTNPSDSPAEVLLLKSWTPNATLSYVPYSWKY